MCVCVWFCMSCSPDTAFDPLVPGDQESAIRYGCEFLSGDPPDIVEG